MRTFLYGLIALVLSLGVGLIAYQVLVQKPADTGVSIDSVCGNGTQEPGEQCDDGNLASGDGCDASCDVEEGSGPSACVSRTETITVNIPGLSKNDKCVWHSSGRKNEKTRGLRNTETIVNVPGRTCGISSLGSVAIGGASNGKIRYDDEILFTVNDILLFASDARQFNAVPLNADGLPTFTSINQILNLRNDHGGTHKCIGSGTCQIPNTQKTGVISVSIPDGTSQAIGESIGSPDQLSFKLYATGDNDTDIDCTTSGITLEIELEVVDEGCDCDYVPPVCGNGIQELGEECDGDGSDYSCGEPGTANECQAIYECSDGLDNDGDGFIDCTEGAEDPGCFPDGRGGGGECNPRDNDERNPICGNGIVEDGEQCDDGDDNADSGALCSTACYVNAQCNNGIDDDEDGFIDCTPGAEDPGCFPDENGGGGACDPEDDDEYNAPETCGDGIVDDGEECDDGNDVNTGDICANDCRLNPECSDGLDNDDDGFIDCTVGAEDPGCYPDGNGGGGSCNPLDDNEIDLIAAPVTIPDTAFGDEASHYLIVGFIMVIAGALVYKIKFIDQISLALNSKSQAKKNEYEQHVESDSERKI